MFSYIGGKSRQAKWISSFVPPIKRYVEIFGGAMWVYINGNIECEEAIYNDVNLYLVNVFNRFKTPDRMIAAMEKYEPKNRKLFDTLMEEFKNTDFDRKYDIDEAAKYVYCITHSFSGLLAGYSDQSKQKHSKYLAVVNRLKKEEVREKLRKLNTSNLSFEDCLNKYDAEDNYFYLDPPYYGKENYYKFHGFTVEDHKRLSEILKSGLQSKWALSYYYFNDLELWFPRDQYKWELKKFNRSASAQAGKSTKDLEPGEEILVMNYDRVEEERVDLLENTDIFFE